MPSSNKPLWAGLCSFHSSVHVCCPVSLLFWRWVGWFVVIRYLLYKCHVCFCCNSLTPVFMFDLFCKSHSGGCSTGTKSSGAFLEMHIFRWELRADSLFFDNQGEAWTLQLIKHRGDTLNDWSADNRRPCKSCCLYCCCLYAAPFALKRPEKRGKRALSLVEILGGRAVRDCIAERGNWEWVNLVNRKLTSGKDVYSQVCLPQGTHRWRHRLPISVKTLYHVWKSLYE